MAAQAADDYPARPVRIVVGFAAGSTADVTARALAPKLGQSLGQQFVVENRIGAGSSIAADAVAHAPKDGYTLFFATVANSINAAMSSKLNFDFARDFAPITLVATVPNILLVHPSTGVRTVEELITAVKLKPGQFSYGSSGVGTANHLWGELFNFMAGTKMVHVPYPGAVQAVAGSAGWPHTDPVRARIDGVAAGARGQAHRARLDAIQRASIAPDLPTMSEAGLKGFDAGVWRG